VRSKLRVFLALAGLVGLVGCTRTEEPKKDPATNEAPSAQSPSTPLVLAPKGIRFEHAPKGDDLAAIVKKARESAAANGRDLVVYVGAKWCEPCQRFHQAAERGELDEQFPNLTILDFDLDEDRERLVSAGYESKLIPLFVVPDASGRASDKRFEGSVKGDSAVSNIAPRLRQILSK
jgi:thiol-disulfide isomerase/thioredoxin